MDVCKSRKVSLTNPEVYKSRSVRFAKEERSAPQFRRLSSIKVRFSTQDVYKIRRVRLANWMFAKAGKVRFLIRMIEKQKGQVR